MGLPSPKEMYVAAARTKEYHDALSKVGSLCALAAAEKAGLLGTYYARLSAIFDAETIAEAITVRTDSGLVATDSGGAVVDGALPVVTLVGVLSALGSGYAAAREAARNYETELGFSHGFVTRILHWHWDDVLDRFAKHFHGRSIFDDGTGSTPVNSYDRGLRVGHLAGLALPAEQKTAYVRRIRRLAVTTTAGWDARSDDWQEKMRARRVQINYVIDLAHAARKHGLIRPE